MCSKIFIFIFSYLLFTNLYSAEIVIQGNSKVEYNDFTFTDNSKYIIINYASANIFSPASIASSMVPLRLKAASGR